MQKIKAHNAEGHSWTMGVNKFADLTAEEFKALYASGYRAQEKRSKNVNLSLLHSNANPASVDWTTKGASRGQRGARGGGRQTGPRARAVGPPPHPSPPAAPPTPTPRSRPPRLPPPQAP